MLTLSGPSRGLFPARSPLLGPVIDSSPADDRVRETRLGVFRSIHAPRPRTSTMIDELNWCSIVYRSILYSAGDAGSIAAAMDRPQRQATNS